MSLIEQLKSNLRQQKLSYLNHQTKAGAEGGAILVPDWTWTPWDVVRW